MLLLSSIDFFSKRTFSKIPSGTLSEGKRLESRSGLEVIKLEYSLFEYELKFYNLEARTRADLHPNCLQMLSAGGSSRRYSKKRVKNSA